MHLYILTVAGSLKLFWRSGCLYRKVARRRVFEDGWMALPLQDSVTFASSNYTFTNRWYKYCLFTLTDTSKHKLLLKLTFNDLVWSLSFFSFNLCSLLPKMYKLNHQIQEQHLQPGRDPLPPISHIYVFSSGFHHLIHLNRLMSLMLPLLCRH